jgi:hypothetical protein
MLPNAVPLQLLAAFWRLCMCLIHPLLTYSMAVLGECYYHRSYTVTADL